MKAYTPEVASGATSSAVKTNFKGLEGSSPLQTFKTDAQPNGNPHVRIGPQAFNQPSHGAGLLGNSGQHIQNNEVRNSANGIPHMSMKPGRV